MGLLIFPNLYMFGYLAVSFGLFYLIEVAWVETTKKYYRPSRTKYYLSLFQNLLANKLDLGFFFLKKST